LTAYRFTYPYPKFYPDVKGADGRSLTATPGDVADFDIPPGDGCWLPVEEVPEVQAAPEPVTPEVPAEPGPAPEPAPEAPAPAPAPAEPAPWTFPGFSPVNA
jgi:hypothetical protein